MKILVAFKTIIVAFSLICSINVKAAETLRVSDLILDYNTFAGKEISLYGCFLQMGTIAFLYEECGSMTAVNVDVSKADRETRKYLLKNCGTGCEVSFVGTPGVVMYQNGFIVTTMSR